MTAKQSKKVSEILKLGLKGTNSNIIDQEILQNSNGEIYLTYMDISIKSAPKTNTVLIDKNGNVKKDTLEFNSIAERYNYFNNMKKL